MIATVLRLSLCVARRTRRAVHVVREGRRYRAARLLEQREV